MLKLVSINPYIGFNLGVDVLKWSEHLAILVARLISVYLMY